MGFSSVSNEVSNVFLLYGWPGIAALFVLTVTIILGYYFIKNNNKKTVYNINEGFSKLTSTMANQNEKLVNSIIESQNEANKQAENTRERIYEVITKVIDKKLEEKEHKHAENLDYRLEISKTIDKTLWDLFNRYNCNRISLIEFHNSKENLNGLPFLWYDVHYEKTSKGIKSRVKENQPTSAILPIIDDLSKAKHGYIKYNRDDIEKIYERSTILYNYLTEDLKTNGCIYIGIYNKYFKMVGIVALDYITLDIPENIMNYDDICKTVAGIAPLLELKSA